MYVDNVGETMSDFSLSASITELDSTHKVEGHVLIELVDMDTGEILYKKAKKNVITLDQGVFAAMRSAAGFAPSPPLSGVVMLSIGTGATGPYLTPDPPDARQRRLNAEIARKPFSSVVYRTASGSVSTVPTRVVDFVTVFSEGDAVGRINEMGLVCPVSSNPLVRNPVPAVFPAYDPTVDLRTYDVLFNYFTCEPFPMGPRTALTITWRITH